MEFFHDIDAIIEPLTHAGLHLVLFVVFVWQAVRLFRIGHPTNLRSVIRLLLESLFLGAFYTLSVLFGLKFVEVAALYINKIFDILKDPLEPVSKVYHSQEVESVRHSIGN